MIEKTLNIALLEPKEASSNVVQEYKASQVKIRSNQINVSDKIEIHNRIGEIVFSDLLQSTIINYKLQTNLENLEHQLKKEKIVNKAC